MSRTKHFKISKYLKYFIIFFDYTKKDYVLEICTLRFETPT